jgi:ferredoxin-NADP reductase/Na+-translocating ferredoxin:NAD+ oxidoreductase RnfD subunit
MLGPIDDFLDKITMYRLVLYYLIGLLIAAFGLSIAGVLNFSPQYVLLSTAILLAACWALNKLFAWFLKAPSNSESTLITALILALIISPMSSLYQLNITFLLAAAGLAIASKYLLNIKNKHIFNPAAIAVALTALGPKQGATWWVGASALLPFVLIGGFLVVRKLRRWRMVLSFFAASIVATIAYNLIGHSSVTVALHKTFTDSALFFLGFVMLTEPQTMPPTSAKQTWYGAIVGLLFPPQAHIFTFYFTPELALLAGNIFSYVVSPKGRFVLHLKQRVKKSPDIMDFVLTSDRSLSYEPGQYMEFTLAHPHADNRGVRRYLTLASSPTESDVHLGIKFYEPSSTFKKTMLAMTPETTMVAAQLTGDFVLPKDSSQKLTFIAGGIGVTPFRSMAKYLIDTEQTRSVSMLYGARTVDDFAYHEIFEEARETFGMDTTYVVSDPRGAALGAYMRAGLITGTLITEILPDYKERTFYISGTHHMVEALQKILHELDVPAHQIKIDFFPGYA